MYLNTLDICFRWILSRVQYGQSLGGSAPILRVLFSLHVSDVFRGGSKVGGKFSRRSRVSWIESHPTSSGSPILSLALIFSGISDLLSLLGLWPYYRFSQDLDPKFLPEYRGFRNSWNDCFAIARNVPGSLLSAFCYSRLDTKKVLSGFFPSLWEDI